MSFISTHRERWGIEPVCKTLQVAPSTYYAAISNAPSARQVVDDQLKLEIARVHRDNFSVYGIEKVWRQLKREGKKVGRDRVARLMDERELEGVVRGKRKRTTLPAGPADCAPASYFGRVAIRIAGRCFLVFRSAADPPARCRRSESTKAASPHA